MSPDVRSALSLWKAMDAVMTETRWQPGLYGQATRNLVIALTWARHTYRGADIPWSVVRDYAGWPKDRNFGLREAIADDAPRFEPPPGDKPWQRPCEAPMIRREGQCGKHGTWQARITDPATGRYRWGAWCNRHRDFYEEARRIDGMRRDAGTVPEPAPNVGGLLVLHVPSPQWPDLYAWARPMWEPPALGLNPNDWPVLEKVHQAEPPMLRALTGGGEAAAGPPPSLRLLTGDAS